MVAVDDEQWVDPDSLRLLESAVARLRDAPVRWLVAVRSGHTGRGLAQMLDHELAEATTWVDLAGLDDTALSQLVMDRFPGRWSPGVLHRLVTLAAGSPYASLELARETIAQGGHNGTAVHLPATLADSLRSRLDRLSPDVLAVVQAAAVADTPTWALLRAVCGQAAAGQVDEALEAGVLDVDPPDPVLRFSHPLLREAAESMLTGPGRRRLHRAIGAALADPDQAAWHLARGADEPDETLAARAEQAARHAGARGAPARAVALAQAAAELTPDPDSLPAWRRRISWLELMNTATEFEQVRSLGEKWAPHVPPSLRGRLAAVRAAVAVQADIEVACQFYGEAFAELAGRDPAQAAQAGGNWCLDIGILLGRLDEARSCVGPVIAQARAAGNPIALRQALGAAGGLAAAAGDPGAGDQLRGAVRLPGFTDMPFPYESPETWLAFWHMWRGEFDPARDLMKAVLEAGERRGSPESTVAMTLHLVELEWRAGNWDTAAAHVAWGARWSRERSYGQEEVRTYYFSLIAAGRGNLEVARELAATGVAQAEARSDWLYAAHCRSVLGLAELSAEDPAAALRWLEPVADMLQDGGIGEPGRFTFTPDLIEAWAATGQLDRAAGRLAWLQDAARRLDHPWARITAGRAQVALRLAQRDPAAAVNAVAAVIPEAREARAPVRARPLSAGAGHRAAQSPAASRRRGHPRRGRRRVYRPGRAAVAGPGRGAARPPGAGPR
jgi:hypothetical protein